MREYLCVSAKFGVCARVHAWRACACICDDFDKVSLLAILTFTMTRSDTHVNAGADKSFSTRTKTGCEAKTFIIGIPVGRFNVCTMHRRKHAPTHTHSCTHASIVEKLCKYDGISG